MADRKHRMAERSPGPVLPAGSAALLVRCCWRSTARSPSSAPCSGRLASWDSPWAGRTDPRPAQASERSWCWRRGSDDGEQTYRWRTQDCRRWTSVDEDTILSCSIFKHRNMKWPVLWQTVLYLRLVTSAPGLWCFALLKHNLCVLPQNALWYRYFSACQWHHHFLWHNITPSPSNYFDVASYSFSIVSWALSTFFTP